MNSTQNQKVSIINNSNKPLGYLVWWSIKEGMVTLPQLQQAAINNSIPQNFLPKEISAGRAFKRALNKMEKQSNSGQKYRGLVLTKASEDKTRIVFTVHERNIDSSGEDVYIDQADRIVFNKEVGYIDYGSGRYADIVRELLGESQTFFNSNDIRLIVVALIQDYIGAFAARDRGAVYFVPHHKLAQLENVKKFIQQTVGGGVVDWPVYEEKKADIRGICLDEMKKELANLQEEAQRAIDEGKQARVFLNRIEQMKKYQKQLKGYAELLEMDIEEINAIVEKSKQQMEAMIDLF